MQDNTRWYQKSVWIIVLLIFFFPVGLILMWLYSNWSRKAKWIITGLFILFVVIGSTGKSSNSSQKISGANIETTKTPTLVPTTAPSPTSPEPTLTQASSEITTVKRVIDGDTIELGSGEKVRYIGIDTPESVDPRKPVQCFGQEALSKNKEMVEGKIVKLEKDISEKDTYGRFLRYVWVGDIFVNDYLVREGYANASSYPPDVKYQDLFQLAEQEAREGNKGLWKGCTAKPTNKVIVPTTIQSSSQQTSGNCVIKGNISSSGEKIYHLPGCGSYAKTGIDTSTGERWFCSEQEAVQAGWRKAKNC